MRLDSGVPLDGPVDVRPYARAAEQEGFDGFWVSEVKHDPFVALALAAVATERVALGTSIALAFARNPMTTAAAADDLQALSQGRLHLGLGSQVRAHISRRFSMPWSQPARRMREYVCALRAIWDTWHNGAALDFQGEFYTHTLMTPMFQPPRHGFGPPKVLVAGVGDAMTTVAGEVADGFLAHGFTTEPYLRQVTLPALRRGREAVGRSLDGFVVKGSPMVAVGRTPAETARAEAGVRAQIAFYGSTPAYRPVLDLHGWGDLGDRLHGLSREGRWEEMGSMIDDDVLHAFAVVGTPDEAGRALVDRYGDVMDRVNLYTPYDVEPELLGELVASIQAAGSSPA